MLQIEELIWDDFNTKHILKHEVSILEINEACQNIKASFSSRESRIILIGKTKTDRILTMVLAELEDNKYYLITARDSSRKERRLKNEK
jgi:uncharacterized DUF497 family protein